ncbi:MAG TPA: M20/M25/M40 family metallo-hydrolase [Anaeromyxobacteraceae bacterium]|nr:M20/M25/M40 family metallo-hydrolase [Anaeromyxobacteraceae bacterium]
MTDPAADAALAARLADRTAALCATLSPIGEEAALTAQVAAWAARFPHVRRVKDSLVVLVDGRRAPSAARPLVALCGHLDTVPVHEADRGGPRREGGRLVAPGASDMKGGLALMMALAEDLPAAARGCDLALVFYAREEAALEPGAAITRNLQGADRGIRRARHQVHAQPPRGRGRSCPADRLAR